MYLLSYFFNLIRIIFVGSVGVVLQYYFSKSFSDEPRLLDFIPIILCGLAFLIPNLLMGFIGNYIYYGHLSRKADKGYDLIHENLKDILGLFLILLMPLNYLYAFVNSAGSESHIFRINKANMV